MLASPSGTSSQRDAAGGIQPPRDPEGFALRSHVDRILTPATGTCMCVVIQPQTDERVMNPVVWFNISEAEYLFI